MKQFTDEVWNRKRLLNGISENESVENFQPEITALMVPAYLPKKDKLIRLYNDTASSTT